MDHYSRHCSSVHGLVNVFCLCVDEDEEDGSEEMDEKRHTAKLLFNRVFLI